MAQWVKEDLMRPIGFYYIMLMLLRAEKLLRELDLQFGVGWGGGGPQRERGPRARADAECKDCPCLFPNGRTPLPFFLFWLSHFGFVFKKSTPFVFFLPIDYFPIYSFLGPLWIFLNYTLVLFFGSILLFYAIIILFLSPFIFMAPRVFHYLRSEI